MSVPVAPVPVAPVPRCGLTLTEAAASLGMSNDSFRRHVQPHVALLRLGDMVRVSPGELERFVNANAARTLP